MFLLLEKYATERWGLEAFEDVMDAATPRLVTRDPFVGPGSYPDADLVTLVDAAAAASGTIADDLLRDFGRFCFPPLLSRFPWALGGHDLPSFLCTLERTLQIDAQKLLPGVKTPSFRFRAEANRLRVEYRSPRRMCSLAEGLLEGAALHFGARLDLRKRACLHTGADACAWDGTVT